MPAARQLGSGSERQEREAGKGLLLGSGRQPSRRGLFFFLQTISVSREGGFRPGGSLKSKQMLALRPPGRPLTLAALQSLCPSVPPRPLLPLPWAWGRGGWGSGLSWAPGRARSDLRAGLVAVGPEAPGLRRSILSAPPGGPAPVALPAEAGGPGHRLPRRTPRPSALPDHVGPPLPPACCHTLLSDPVGKGWAQRSLEIRGLSGHLAGAARREVAATARVLSPG